MTGLTAVSLFAGIEGVGLALERAGIRVVAAVEIDPDCRTIIARHFPDVALFNDVTQVTGDQLLAAGFVPRRGLLAAGWPCQGNSVAGRRGGMDDPRSGLWRHVVRLLAETHPAWFLGENVPGLLSVNGEADIAVVRGDLAQLGYWWAERILDAQHFGVPQRRRRLFFVGSPRDGIGPVQVLLEPESRDGDPAPGGAAWPGIATAPDGGTVGTLQAGSDGRGWRLGADEAAAGQLIPFDLAQITSAANYSSPKPGDPASPLAATGQPHVAYALASHGQRQDGTVETFITHALTAEGADASEDGTGRGTPLVAMAFAENQRGEVVTSSVSHQLTTGGGKPGQGYPAVSTPTAVRRLTPLECERLQGFPDGWTAGQSDSTRYRQLGNAVAVPCAEWITRRIAAVDASTEQVASPARGPSGKKQGQPHLARFDAAGVKL